MAFVEFKNVYKKYNEGKSSEIVANRDVSFEIEHGEFCVIVGPSGAGKSTILNILGGMDNSTSGEIFIDGKDICKFNKRELNDYRRYDVGFVFQFYNLIPNLTVLENVELAGQIVKESLNPAGVLESVELSHRLKNFPSQLSGGEQQRVAIARALCKNPKLLLCDEPTGALDYNTGKRILDLLHQRCKKTNTTVILITHNMAIAPMADRVIEINDSTVKKVVLNKNPKNIKEIEW